MWVRRSGDGGELRRDKRACVCAATQALASTVPRPAMWIWEVLSLVVEVSDEELGYDSEYGMNGGTVSMCDVSMMIPPFLWAFSLSASSSGSVCSSSCSVGLVDLEESAAVDQRGNFSASGTAKTLNLLFLG